MYAINCSRILLSSSAISFSTSGMISSIVPLMIDCNPFRRETVTRSFAFDDRTHALFLILTLRNCESSTTAPSRDAGSAWFTNVIKELGSLSDDHDFGELGITESHNVFVSLTLI